MGALLLDFLYKNSQGRLNTFGRGQSSSFSPLTAASQLKRRHDGSPPCRSQFLWRVNAVPRVAPQTHPITPSSQSSPIPTDPTGPFSGSARSYWIPAKTPNGLNE